MVFAWLSAVALAITHDGSYALFMGLGFLGAFVAGLVGVGGAILMIPLLLYVPPLFGLPRLTIHTVAGAEMIQVAAAGLAGAMGHWREGRVMGGLVATIGTSMVGAAFAGAILSRFVGAALLTGVFASLALVASVLMLASHRHMKREPVARSPQFDRTVAMALGAGVGFMSGMVGAGGGFLLIPIMLYVLRIPFRVAVGSSLGIVAMSGLAGAVGKAVTGQVDWILALALVAGALPGARVGAIVSRRTRGDVLAVMLGILLAAIAVEMWWDILT